MAELTFLGIANIAVREVNDAHSGARLFEGEGIAPGGPTTNVADVNQWKFVFGIPDNRTAFISSTDWGEFGPIEVVDSPWGGDKAVPWPIDMDIKEADTLMKAAGFSGSYYGATLRWPLTATSTQPLYIFTMGNYHYVFVGVYDKSVTESKEQ